MFGKTTIFFLFFFLLFLLLYLMAILRVSAFAMHALRFVIAMARLHKHWMRPREQDDYVRRRKNNKKKHEGTKKTGQKETYFSEILKMSG